MPMCAHHHILIPGRALLPWRHCTCPAARHGGHTVEVCLDCLDEGRGREAELWPAGHVHGGPELLPWQPPGLPYDQVT